MQQLTTRNDNQAPAPFVPMDPFGGKDSSPELPIRKILSAIMRGKGFVILCALLGALIAAAVSIAQPNVYESRATFLMKFGAENIGAFGNRHVSEIARNAAQILREDQILRNTVGSVGAKTILAPFQPPTIPVSNDDSLMTKLRRWIYTLQQTVHDYDEDEMDEDNAVAELYHGLYIDQSRRAPNVIHVTFLANEPQRAKEILTAYCTAAQEFHKDLYNPKPEYARKRHAATKNKLDQAKVNLNTFTKSLGITDYLQELDDLLQNRRETTTERRQLTSKVEALGNGIKKIQENLKGMPETKTEQKLVEEPNKKIAELEKSLNDTETELREARLQYKKGNPEITNLELKIKGIKADLETERQFPRVTRTVIVKVANTDYELLKKTLHESRQQIEIDKANLAAANKLHKVVDAKIELLSGQRIEFDRLEGEIDQAGRELAAAKVELDRIEDREALTATNQDSLSLIGQPTYVPFKVGPNRTMSTLLGLAAGLGISIVILVFRSLTDSTVRTPEELEEKLGLRVLATVPQLDRKNIRRHERRLISGC